jgi:hypothetical protein
MNKQEVYDQAKHTYKIAEYEKRIHYGDPKKTFDEYMVRRIAVEAAAQLWYKASFELHQ